MKYAIVMARVRRFIKECNLVKFPVNIKELCEMNDIELIKYSSICNTLNITIKEFSRLSSSKDGFTLLIDGVATIFYNDTLLIERQIFTVLHEIGHIFLGHLFIYNTSIIINQKSLENEANCFSRNVIAPVTEILKLNIKKDIEKISCKFSMSKAAAKMRVDFFETDKYNYMLSQKMS